MEARYRFEGGGAVVNPPAFVTDIHDDGFTVTVPIGYQIIVSPVLPPIVQVQNNGLNAQAAQNNGLNGQAAQNNGLNGQAAQNNGLNGQAAQNNGLNGQAAQNNGLNGQAAQPQLIAQIQQAAEHRPLFQHEVLFLLHNDTIPLGAQIDPGPINALHMYPIAFKRRRDGHHYPPGTHQYFNENIGPDNEHVLYRRSYLHHHPDGVITVRRYYLGNADPGKYLIHYIQGEAATVDGDPLIPVLP